MDEEWVVLINRHAARRLTFCSIFQPRYPGSASLLAAPELERFEVLETLGVLRKRYPRRSARFQRRCAGSMQRSDLKSLKPV